MLVVFLLYSPTFCFSRKFLVAYTMDAHIKEPAFIRTLRLKFHCLNPVIKNPKEAGMGMDLK